MAKAISEHDFGGGWTERKLRVVETYLSFFSYVLRATSFQTWYIDAFAGDGGRVSPIAVGGLLGEEDEEQLAGSARIALRTNPGFDRHILIESNRRRSKRLEALKDEFPGKQIEVVREDANTALQELFGRPEWRRRDIQQRGVLFLDPYGLNVRWETLQAAAATQAVDVWYFFNLEGIVRQLPLKGSSIDPDKQACIDALFGTDAWRRAFYQASQESFLDALEPSDMRTADRKGVSDYATARFRELFQYVSDPIAINVPSRGHCFSLYCMSNNPSKPAISAIRRGVDLARKHASDWSRPAAAFHRKSAL